MKYKIKVFIEKEALEVFILKEHSYKNMLAVLCEHATLCLNITNADLEKEWQSPSIEGQRSGSLIRKFCTGHNLRKPQSACEVFSSFMQDKDQLLSYSRSVFILNVTPNEANSLRNKYGLVIISKENLSDEVFQLHMKDTVEKGEIKSDCIDGWEPFFKSRKQPWLPSNSLVISDEYLFKNEVQRVNLGVSNLKRIIPQLLPKELKTEYQILVVSPIPKGNLYIARQIALDMTNYVHGLTLPYTCKITFVFTDAVHTRKAFSNYYVMTCDKGFCLYHDNPPNKVYDTNFVDIMSIFHSASDMAGTSGYDDTSLCLKQLKNICEVAQEQARANISTVLISGDCGPNYEIQNHLFDDV